MTAIVVVQFVLLGLDITIAYIGDLGDTQGDYSALDVLLYLGMRLPWRFYQYAPVAVLIGALIGTLSCALIGAMVGVLISTLIGMLIGMLICIREMVC